MLHDSFGGKVWNDFEPPLINMWVLMRESGGNFYMCQSIPKYSKDIWALEIVLKKLQISMFWGVLKCSISKSSSLVTEWLTLIVT